ncbi:hypothetical protein BH10BAC4_BH10BAC4_13480 [soil metagenome]
MKAIYIILFVIIQTTASAQSVAELDKKGGFKEFKVGDSLATHKEKIKYSKTLENADTRLFLVKERVSVKTYTGEIELKFYKDKVQEVIVSFKNTSKSNFEDLVKSLETLYGDSQSQKKKSPGLARFEKVFVWNGEKIALRIGYDENYRLTEMVFLDQKDTLDKLKEEF